MHIFSPMATGNGAYILHKLLASQISGYVVQGYNPYLTLFPPLLSALKSEIPADIIHTTPDYGDFFAKNTRNLVITFHNYVLDPYMANFSSLLQNIHYRTDLRYFTQKSLKRATAVTAVSHFTANLIKTDLNYTGDIQVIYNGINLNLFTPPPPKLKKNKHLKVLFSGNLTHRKGVQLLPWIADKLSNNIQILYTSGLRTRHSLPDHPRLKNIGSISYTDMPKAYQEADILLFPTIREGFGLAAAEAMACELPVVATDCSSLPELIINYKGGYLCPPKAIDDFAEAINNLAESPTLRKEMGQFNRNRAEKLFSIDRMVKEYIQLFESLGH